MTEGLTPFALIFMTFSMTSVTVLAAWCMYRIFTTDHPPADED